MLLAGLRVSKTGTLELKHNELISYLKLELL